LTHPIYSPRKLIEVALPLDAINLAAAKEKSIRHGHPSTLHLWWARRPLAAARAVIFAQLVNDPGYQQGGGFRYGKNKKEAAEERKRLFKIIEELVLWENTNNETVLERARDEIRRSWREVCDLNRDHPEAAILFNPDKMPGLHDPFAGGGTIPLEAQRLGLKAYASDLNPVAVLINKALIEIPPRFAGHPPVGPKPEDIKGDGLGLNHAWQGAKGLAEDVRRYGAWMRREAFKRIGHLYPKVHITAEMARERNDLKNHVGRDLTVIAWLWARTVKSPNPAFSHVDVPLVSSYVLASKPGTEAYLQPVIAGDKYKFVVKMGVPPKEEANGTKIKGKGSNFRCLVSNSPIEGAYIKSEGMKGRIGQKLLGIIAEGQIGRFFLSPTTEAEEVNKLILPQWKPEIEISGTTQYLGCKPYGMSKFSDLFTTRQLVALNTISDLINESRELIYRDAQVAGMENSEDSLDSGGSGAKAYSEAVGVYLGMVLSRMADRHSCLCRWDPNPSGYAPKIANTFGRQAIPMVWDFVEGNPFSSSSGNLSDASDWVAKVLDVSINSNGWGQAKQSDAQTQTFSNLKFISTDPPYYDNVPYADISDFFYVWLRRSQNVVFPTLFSTVTVPKTEELVAFSYRHSGKEAAETFFLDGMTQTIRNLAISAHPEAPITIYYAFKQSESEDASGTSSTGWVTFLSAIIRAEFAIVGTWPMRTELSNRLRGTDSNALASSIILVCRKRSLDAPTISRREFLRELNSVLPDAMDEMTKGSGGDRSPVAPVDLSQAIIGPGMAVFSKYSAVLEADGSTMNVRTALQLINRFFSEDDFDADTRFCLQWFELNGWKNAGFGDADSLSRSKGTSVNGIKEAGVLESGGGFVRLLKWSEYPSDWDPNADKRNPIWETLHHFIRALKNDGETGAGKLLASTRAQAESVRQLAYRLYTLCERQGWAEDARAYNDLITGWSGIESAAGQDVGPTQRSLFDAQGDPV
jgi:putative DNA methylase